MDARTLLHRCTPVVFLVTSASLFAQQPALPVPSQPAPPSAVLLRAFPVALPGKVDSNSPAVWTLEAGVPRLHVVTSVDGQPSVSAGRRLGQLTQATPVNFVLHPGHGVWMEAILEDAQGAWYGFYHNEIPADLCGRPDRVIPRIGAARSIDNGQTWLDLGIVLEAPPDWHRCDSGNGYFLGGVGDLSAVLDADGTHAYLFFSQYSRHQAAQGIAVARMLWAARDTPVGRVEVWSDGVWLPPSALIERPAGDADKVHVTPRPITWVHSMGTALFPTNLPWHDDDPRNDAFWGASVHWNAYLEQYVMLLNRAADEDWSQDGVYVAFSPTLDDPAHWSEPQRLLDGGEWYPQVIGIERGEGTDRLAGHLARFFMSGRSDYLIEFRR